MTPRERAEQIGKDWYGVELWRNTGTSQQDDEFVALIERAIADAVAEERERCELIADEFDHEIAIWIREHIREGTCLVRP